MYGEYYHLRRDTVQSGRTISTFSEERATSISTIREDKPSKRTRKRQVSIPARHAASSTVSDIDRHVVMTKFLDHVFRTLPVRMCRREFQIYLHRTVVNCLFAWRTLFDPEHRGNIFLRNVGYDLPGYTASQQRR
jgi:hypothetical protein